MTRAELDSTEFMNNSYQVCLHLMERCWNIGARRSRRRWKRFGTSFQCCTSMSCSCFTISPRPPRDRFLKSVRTWAGGQSRLHGACAIPGSALALSASSQEARLCIRGADKKYSERFEKESGEARRIGPRHADGRKGRPQVHALVDSGQLETLGFYGWATWVGRRARRPALNQTV